MRTEGEAKGSQRVLSGQERTEPFHGQGTIERASRAPQAERPDRYLMDTQPLSEPRGHPAQANTNQIADSHSASSLSYRGRHDHHQH